MRKSLRHHFALVAMTILAVAASAPSATAASDDSGRTAGDEPSAQPALAPGVREEAMFNDPYVDRTNWDDYRIHYRVRDLINNTPRGEGINIALHSLSTPWVTDAIINARNRGVAVRVVMSGHWRNHPETRRLKNALGASLNVCDKPGSHPRAARVQACISNRDSSLMHSKFATFSRTVDGGITKTRVVAVTSANMTWSQADTYNNLVIVSGDTATFKGYNAVFDDMFHNRRNDDYQGGDRDGHFTSPAARLTSYFQPRADSKGRTSSEARTDTVADHLSYLTGGRECEVKVAQATIHDTRRGIFEQLARIRKAGCRVRVAYSSIQPEAKQALEKARVSLCLVRDREVSEGATPIHSKYYLVQGTYAGNPNQARVFTGSHNWTLSALRLNDEVILKLWEPDMVQAFNANFEMMWKRGQTPQRKPCGA